MNDLSITQEYFLCSIGDKGKYSSFDMEKGACLVVAGILELLMDNIAVLYGKKVSVQAALPERKSYLKDLYDFIQIKQPVKLEKVVENYSFSFSDKNINSLKGDIGDSLEKAGCVRKEKGGLLGGGIRYFPDAKKRDNVIQRIRAELLENGELTEDIVALTALLSKCEIISHYFSAYEKKDLKRRLKEIKESPENQLVSKMVDYIETLLVMIVITAS